MNPRLLSAFALVAPAVAQTIDVADEAPISSLLEALPADVVTYDAHVTFLAHPFLEGRLPGTRGMEIAKDYCEQYFIDMGLEPVFDGSYRQPFSLGSKKFVQAAELAVASNSLAEGVDYSITGMGVGGEVTGPVVFCGYGIESGRNDYEGFPDGADIQGKVAVIFRFEPMDEEGKSLWSTRRGWSTKAGFSRKLRGLEERGATAIIIVNPPGADDSRVESMMQVGDSGRAYVDIPVLMMVPSGGEAMLRAGGMGEGSLMGLRREADAAGVVKDLGFNVSITAEIDEEPLMAENVIGMLPGKGNLKDEIIVLGAHLDHLGMGNFGSREGSGKLHPGADDNASGSAAVIMIAEDLVDDYSRLSDGDNARTMLFMLFDAEESGLIGSAYYTKNPAFPIENHKLMANFDMIGRITNKRLSLSGAQTGEGLQEFLDPLIEACPLEIVQPENMSGASDHTPFYRAGMPVLFSIIADFHDDYHTSRDTVDKINRVDAVHTIDFFHNILSAAAVRPEAFPYIAPQRGGRNRPQVEVTVEEAEPEGPVSLGVRAIDSGSGGVELSSVTEGGSAGEAGLRAGDRLVKWNSIQVSGLDGLREVLGKCKIGDKVQVTVMRDGAEKVFWITLQGQG